MKILEKFENKKGNKLIFRQNTSDIPSLGSSVLLEKSTQTSTSSKNKKYTEIGKIIDIFGPVKDPWVVVNLFSDKELQYDKLVFYWKKKDHFKKNFSKNDSRKKKKNFKRDD